MRRLAPVCAVAVLVGCAGGSEPVDVPGVRSAGVRYAYERLHAAGLGVSIPGGLRSESLCTPIVGDQRPRAGARVDRGEPVSLLRPFCFRGSIAVPRTLPAARVPSFVGGSAARAVSWADRKELFWRVRLGALRDGDADELLENYTVVSQQPAPGTRLALGTRLRHGFRPTPLELVARQR